MTATLCPYCQGPISDTEESIVCSGCETPHHKDCYEENNGCTVFGCQCAPPEEPKLSVSTPELMNAGTAAQAVTTLSATVSATAPPPAPPPPPARAMTTEELQQIAYRVVPSIFSSYDDSPASDTALEQTTSPGEPKNRMGFMILGALLGPFGAHNWYAGYYKKAGAQLAITVLTLGFGAPMSWIWAIIDICTVDRDNNGVQFNS
jgi:Prokaryotic RING finger family 1/TM2 domain